MAEYYKPNEFAKMIGVSVPTLQRWDRTGALKAYRNPANRRYYTHDQLLNYTHPGSVRPAAAAYVRVSSPDQVTDLLKQAEFLKDYADKNGIKIDIIYKETGSGLDFERKIWNKIIKKCVKGEINKLLIAHRDRFSRFGFEWFRNMLADLGVEIIIAGNDYEFSPDEELLEDLSAIIDEFAERVAGLN